MPFVSMVCYLSEQPAFWTEAVSPQGSHVTVISSTSHLIEFYSLSHDNEAAITDPEFFGVSQP